MALVVSSLSERPNNPYVLRHMPYFYARSPCSHLIKFVADQSKCFKDGLSVPSNCNNPLRTTSITDVDFCTTLTRKTKISCHS